MALSEQEREWLERRKNLCNRCARRRFCEIGKKHGFNTAACRFWEAMNPKGELLVRAYFRESAEFEARVAEKLARNICIYCPDALARKSCPSAFEYPRRTGESCRLMHARLAVEAEMDK